MFFFFLFNEESYPNQIAFSGSNQLHRTGQTLVLVTSYIVIELNKLKV